MNRILIVFILALFSACNSSDTSNNIIKGKVAVQKNSYDFLMKKADENTLDKRQNTSKNTIISHSKIIYDQLSDKINFQVNLTRFQIIFLWIHVKLD